MNCDRVAAVRVMLADGRVIRATRDLNPSLLWAVRGGTGGNFGVLLDVTYDLAELYIVWGFALQWPIDDAPRVLAAIQEGFMRAGEAPDELGFRCMLATMGGRQVLLMLGVFDGDRQAGMEVLAPLTAIGACTMAMDATDTYTVLNERLLHVSAELVAGWAGTYSAHRSGFVVRPLGVDGWMAVVEHFKSTPHALNVAVITAYGGQVSRIPADDCAFVHRAVDMNVSVDAAWDTGGQSSTEEKAWDWANGFLDVLAPFRDGSVYQNLPERGLADYRSAYWGSNFGRLLAVKRIADPCDVFTHPQGVSPDPADTTVVPRLPELEPEPDLKNVYGGFPRGLGTLTPDEASAVSDRSDPRRTAAMPPRAGTLRERLAELSDLGRAGALLAWDQEVMMPAGGGPARGAILGTVLDLARERLVSPELSLLLARGDPDDRVTRVLGRDQARARRVPTQLTAELDRAGSEGMALWLDARAHNDFGRVEPAVRRNIQLARAYADCFPESEHPYDALLDRYEPGVTTAEIRALLERLCDGLAPLVADLAVRDVPVPLAGHFPVAAQRAVAQEIAAAMGFDADGFRLDSAALSFACATAPTDVRVVARFEDGNLEGLFRFLHGMGHAVYERGTDPALARTTLDIGASMGVHESQGRLWENLVGRGAPFWSWWLPRLRQALPDSLPDVALDDFLRAINVVRPTAILEEADEVTLALHILLRFELEIRLVEGALDPADLPAAWAQRTRELLGIEVPDDLHGVLQDVHWTEGIFGYFPVYAIGNVFAAQLWDAVRADLPGLDDDLRAGDYRALCDWLRDRVHRHGRTLQPLELVEHAVGGPLDPGPLLAHLDTKYRVLYRLP
jgi:carboxypeptidase Taq